MIQVDFGLTAIVSDKNRNVGSKTLIFTKPFAECPAVRRGELPLNNINLKKYYYERIMVRHRLL
jgi:hypothetical protein